MTVASNRVALLQGLTVLSFLALAGGVTCAGDEIGVKLNNACAESYDILTADLLVRFPPGAHTATCWPGWF